MGMGRSIKLISPPSPQVIDFWSLDVEGAELEAIQNFPWDRVRVIVLMVEVGSRHRDVET